MNSTGETVYRIEVDGADRFDPHEWLRREVLWASLMSPYDEQLQRWFAGRAHDQHAGNRTRQHVYEGEDNPELQALAFFNHGKTIGGIISSAVLFRITLDRSVEVGINHLEEQARVVTSVLGREPGDFTPEEVSEEASFSACSALAKAIAKKDLDLLVKNEKRLRVSNIMSALACREAKIWVGASLQNSEQTLPVLTIPNGGYPRSVGDRVDRLQPIFHQIVDSEQYQALAA